MSYFSRGVMKVVGYVSLKFRRKVWFGDIIFEVINI